MIDFEPNYLTFDRHGISGSHLAVSAGQTVQRRRRPDRDSTWRSWVRRSTRCARPSRRRPTSRGSEHSEASSTSSAAGPETSSTRPRACVLDLMSAHYLRVTSQGYVNRGYEPTNPYFGYHEMPDLSGLPPLLGL